MPNTGQGYRPQGSCLSLSASSTSGSIAQPAHSVALMITNVSNDVYWTLDGSIPSATNGVVLKAGAQPLVLPIGPVGSNPLTHTFKTVTTSVTSTVTLQPLSG